MQQIYGGVYEKGLQRKLHKLRRNLLFQGSMPSYSAGIGLRTLLLFEDLPFSNAVGSGS